MGFMTDEKRKEAYNWSGSYFRFQTCYDLSRGITVVPLYANFKGDIKDMELYSKDLAIFMFYHTYEIRPKLNGFSGYDTISFNFQMPSE